MSSGMYYREGGAFFPDIFYKMYVFRAYMAGREKNFF